MSSCLHVATHDVIQNVLRVYLPLSSSPGMTISYFCHDAKRGGRGPRLNVLMTLIFLKIVWKCPLTKSMVLTEFCVSNCVFCNLIGLQNFSSEHKTQYALRAQVWFLQINVVKGLVTRLRTHLSDRGSKLLLGEPIKNHRLNSKYAEIQEPIDLVCCSSFYDFIVPKLCAKNMVIMGFLILYGDYILTDIHATGPPTFILYEW